MKKEKERNVELSEKSVWIGGEEKRRVWGRCRESLGSMDENVLWDNGCST